ncbi:hypothetical protein ACFZDG_34050 [Kitasatospora xanthocidica]
MALKPLAKQVTIASFENAIAVNTASSQGEPKSRHGMILEP